MKKAIIFDMDGTLLDSLDEIVTSWNQVYATMPEYDLHLTKTQLVSLMGKTMDMFAKTLTPNLSPDEQNRVLHLCETAENNYIREHGAKIYGDIRGTFEGLRELGFTVLIVSNCQDGYIEAFLDHFDLWPSVDGTLCYGDTGETKPRNIRTIIEKHDITDAWYVGDTQGDYDACQEAGVPFIFADYGFGTVDADTPVIHAIEQIVDLAKTLA